MKNVKRKIDSQCFHINIGVRQFAHHIASSMVHNKIRLLILDANRITSNVRIQL